VIDPDPMDPPEDSLRRYRLAVFAYRDAFKAGKDTSAERVAMGKVYNTLSRSDQLKADAFWERAQKAWP
jgi:hypothetical protein